MNYVGLKEATLHKKVNRFIAEVFVDGQLEQVHIKNTGRLTELMLQGAKVLLEPSSNPKRKTRYSLVAINYMDTWVSVDSQIPNLVAFHAIATGQIHQIGQVDVLKKEVKRGSSRFDLYYEKGTRKGFVEVKGVTLAKSGVAKFPDAPSIRATKHVLELTELLKKGYEATVLFIVQIPNCTHFEPFAEMDNAFSNALKHGAQQGLQVIAYEGIFRDDTVHLGRELRIKLPIN